VSLQKLIKHTNDSGLTPVDVEAVKLWFINNGFQDEINFIPSPFDPRKLRGMIRRTSVVTGVYTEKKWVSDILYAEGLNTCWTNFVCCKEMVHIFDKKQSCAQTAEAIEELTANLTDPMLRINPSLQATADISAQVKALAVLAPATEIENLRPSYDEGRRSERDIAEIFKIPQYYIKMAMSSEFATLRPYL
jgi:hypothetical protein